MRRPDDFALHMRAMSAQYELARAAILMLSVETTRLAAVSAMSVQRNTDASSSHAAELFAIVADVNRTLADAVDPVRIATHTLDHLTVAHPEPSTMAEHAREALLVAECETLVRSLGTAIEALHES